MKRKIAALTAAVTLIAGYPYYQLADNTVYAVQNAESESQLKESDEKIKLPFIPYEVIAAENTTTTTAYRTTLPLTTTTMTTTKVILTSIDGRV